ncbi:MAG: hypothetical protein LIP28_09145 [Deltaproteobacteria bacterium]|nr:hypothetical protein [Deltaproteobacteria bacterium]
MNTSKKTYAVDARPKFTLIESEKAHLRKEYESNPVSSGRTQYLRYLNGEKLTHKEAVHAKCAECCGGYADGRQDCGIPACPLYQFMPYKGKIDHISEDEGGVGHE